MTEIHDLNAETDAPGAPGQTPSPGPGYWLASDGNWYPPEQRPSVAPPPAPVYAVQPAPASNGLATASMVLGIIAVVLFWSFGFSALIGIVAVVLGAVGVSKSSSLPNRAGRGQAIAGIITGGLGIVAGIFMVAGIAALGQEAEGRFERVGEEIESGDFEGVNSDPSDGFCNEDRWLQDPDC